jgi:hypothetical protein
MRSGEWVCWNFHEMRVRPTRYTIKTTWMKSWVLEASMDGRRWVEIDVQTNNQDFLTFMNTASFFVANPMNCQFIRLTQTEAHRRLDGLLLCAVEFFGTLTE